MNKLHTFGAVCAFFEPDIVDLELGKGNYIYYNITGRASNKIKDADDSAFEEDKYMVDHSYEKSDFEFTVDDLMDFAVTDIVYERFWSIDKIKVTIAIDVKDPNELEKFIKEKHEKEKKISDTLSDYKKRFWEVMAKWKNDIYEKTRLSSDEDVAKFFDEALKGIKNYPEKSDSECKNDEEKCDSFAKTVCKNGENDVKNQCEDCDNDSCKDDIISLDKLVRPLEFTATLPDHFYENLKKVSDPVQNRHFSVKLEKNVDEECDNVNHPKHYASASNGIECIDAIEAATERLLGLEAVCTGNVLKYIWRWKDKNGIEDLKKAKWYLEKLIEEVSDCEEKG